MGLWGSCKIDSDSVMAKTIMCPPRVSSGSQCQMCHAAVEGSQLRKAMQALTSDGLASVSNDVFAEVLTKHPQVPLPLSLPPYEPAPSHVRITAKGVVRSLKPISSGPSTSRRPSSATPQNVPHQDAVPHPCRPCKKNKMVGYGQWLWRRFGAV